MLTARNSLSATYVNEMGHFKSNLKNALGYGLSEGFAAVVVRGGGKQAAPE